MGDHQGAGREFFAGAGARDRQAHDLRGRRREAVDLLVPGRGAARVRGDARAFRARLHRHAQLDFARPKFKHSFRSGDDRAAARSTRCSSRRRRMRGLTADAGRDRCTRRCRQAAPGLVELWEPIEARRAQATSKAGTRRSTPQRDAARAVKLARSASRAARGDCGDGAAAALRQATAGAGAPARRRCSRRSSAR